MANRQKTVYICSECGDTTSKWFGQCPSCGKWNTLEEYEPQPETAQRRRSAAMYVINKTSRPNGAGCTFISRCPSR